MGIKINCICKQEHGFAIGLSGYGLLCIYKDKEGSYMLESSSKIQKRDVQSIHCISSSYDNSHIAVVAKIKRKFASEVSEFGEGSQNTILEAFIFNSSLVNAIKVSYKEPFEFLDEHGPHSQAITHMAICPTKSLLGTLSEDKTLKFWNYQSSDKQLFSFEFHMSQQAFDIHPMSIQCVVGFKEGIKIYFLLENDLEPCYENFSKSCKAVKYSEGGQYLAIGFVNQVHVICPFRLKTVKMLGGHSGNIKKLLWKERDRYLVSMCQNSTVFVWDSYNNWNLIVEQYIANKNHQYLSVDYDSELDILVCCCSDSTVKFFRNKGSE
jgi:WD40 repeat protein